MGGPASSCLTAVILVRRRWTPSGVIPDAQQVSDWPGAAWMNIFCQLADVFVCEPHTKHVNDDAYLCPTRSPISLGSYLSRSVSAASSFPLRSGLCSRARQFSPLFHSSLVGRPVLSEARAALSRVGLGSLCWTRNLDSPATCLPSRSAASRTDRVSCTWSRTGSGRCWPSPEAWARHGCLAAFHVWQRPPGATCDGFPGGLWPHDP